MELIIESNLKKVSGGISCEDSLIQNVLDSDPYFPFPVRHCTKDQYRKYVNSMLDYLYDSNAEHTSSMEIATIQSLHL